MAAPRFRPDPRRDAAAAELARGASCWPVVTLKVAVGAFRPGERFFAVPSSDGATRYLTNARFCSCPDYQQRGSGCKHQRAASLHLAALAGADEAPAAARRATCMVCTQALPAAVLAGVCDDCAEAGLMFAGVEAGKVLFGSDAGDVVRLVR